MILPYNHMSYNVMQNQLKIILWYLLVTTNSSFVTIEYLEL